MLSWMRRQLGVAGYWSLAGYAKRKVKTAVSFIYDFEDSVVRDVKGRGYDGVICGHIHAATIKQIEGVTYINCGDRVDSCTAIVEHFDGRMELVEWGVSARPPAPLVRASAAEALGVAEAPEEHHERDPQTVRTTSTLSALTHGLRAVSG